MKLPHLFMIPVAVLIAVTAFTRIANTRGAPQDRTYDVLRYDLEFDLRPGPGAFAGVNTITFALAGRAPEVGFDASSRTITVDSVIGRTGPLRFSHAGNELRVSLPGGPPGPDTPSVAVHYRAIPAFDGRYDSGGVYFHPENGLPRVGTISQPNFAREWWPCNDRPSDKALVSLTCTTPAGMIAVSNGRRTPLKTEPPGNPVGDADTAAATFRWESAYPVATYLVFLGAADYAVTADTMRTSDGATLELFTYTFPEDSANAAADFTNIKTILRYFSETFGPYPFIDDKFALAEVEGRLTMENQTVVTIEKDLITGDRRNENTLVHETAHQWWGNLVTPSTWKHIWLAEGFATMSEALYVESRRGAEAYNEYMGVLMDQPGGFYDGAIVGSDSATFWESFSPAVYYKGALILHMLRRMVGDPVFFRSLRDYLDGADRRYATASTEDFIGVCEANHGSDLDWFFRQWLWPPQGATDRPALAYDWTTVNAGGGTELVLTVRQEQEGPLVYRLPLSVAVYSGGTATSFSVTDSARVQTFRRPVAAVVDSVLIDPHRDIFMNIRRDQRR